MSYKQTMQERINEIVRKLSNEELDEDDVEEFEQELEELCEIMDVQVKFNRFDGKRRHYVPLSHWEPSNCEWEQSSEYGETHGWVYW